MFRVLLIGAMMAGPAAAENADALNLRAVEAYDAGESALAARLWRQSADAGCADAMTAYASLLEDGDGVDADVDAARRWYVRAARRGDAHAMVMLAETYAADDPADRRAAELFRAAAAQGHPFAIRRLARPPRADDVVSTGANGDEDQ